MINILEFLKRLIGINTLPDIALTFHASFGDRLVNGSKRDTAVALLVEDLTAHYAIIADLYLRKPCLDGDTKLQSGWLDDMLKARQRTREILKIFLDLDDPDALKAVDLAAVYQHLSELAPDPRDKAHFYRRRRKEARQPEPAALPTEARTDDQAVQDLLPDVQEREPSLDLNHH